MVGASVLRPLHTLILTATCVLTIATAASLAAAPNAAVPNGGKVFGKGYSGWLAIAWQTLLAGPPDGPVCDNGHGAVILFGGGTGLPEAHTCFVRAGQPVYASGLADECSNREKEPFHAETTAELKRCARRHFKGATNLTATIDGTPVDGYDRLITGSPVFKFHLPKRNLMHSRRRSGKGAAYGIGLLIGTLTAGAHTVRVTGDFPGFKSDVIYTLLVP
jgi:hypothetical protein